MSDFPTSIDSFTDEIDATSYPVASDMNGVYDSIEKIEAKIGIDGSVVSTSLDYKIKNTTSGHDHDGSDSKKVITTNLDNTGLTVSQLLRVNSTGTVIESSGKTVPTGDIVGTSDTQTLTGKTLTSPKINENVALTVTATELNKLAGTPVGLTSTEIGYLDGVTSAIQTQLDAKTTLAVVLSAVYPIGSLYFNYSNGTNPGTLLGFGTWVAAGVGRAIVGIDATQTEFDTAGETGGEKTHLLTGVESGTAAHGHGITDPTHRHSIGTASGDQDGSGSNGWIAGTSYTSYVATGVTVNNSSSVSAASAHNNLQPYEVYYIWRRTV